MDEGTACSLLNLRNCSPRFGDAKDKRHEDLSGSARLDRRRGLRFGVDGIGGMALSLREGIYTRGSAKLSSKLANIGELYRRGMVPTESRLETLES